jgi:hypothetical protein
MKNLLLKIFCSVVIFVAASAAFAEGSAGIHFLPKLMYMINNTNNNGSTSNSSRILADGGLGYKFMSPLYIGAQYGYDSTSTTSGGTTTATYSGYGPSVGLMTDNVDFIFTYYVSSQFQNTSGSTTTYTGNGWQLDFAYLFPIGGKATLGPALSYRSLTYTTVQPAVGPSTSTNYTYTTLLPYIALNIAF